MRSVLALLLLIAVAFGAASAVHSEATMDVENVIDEDAAEDFAVAEETAEEETEDEATEEAEEEEEEEEAAEEMSFAEVDADVEVDAEDAIDAELVDSLDEVADDAEEDVAEEDSENESESFVARGVGASCQSNTGTCIDTLKTKCGGSLIRGQCSGAASVVCCVPPARPAATTPSAPASNAFPAGYDHSVGLRAELTPAGVNNLANLITVVVNSVFSKPFPLANVDLNQDGLAFTATGMNVQSMKIGGVALKVVAPSDLTGSLANANAVVVVPSFVASKTSGFPKLTAKGALTITASNIGLKFNIRVGANTKGDSRLSATVTSLQMTADGLSFKFSQSWDSFILNGVQNLFKKVIMNTITKAVSTTGVDTINAQLAQVLNAVPLSIPFAAGPLSCTVHYGFEQVGLDTDGSLQLGQSFGVQCK